MKKTLSSKIHRGIYGKSDEPNAKENKNEYFQRGYQLGLNGKDEIADIITQNYVIWGKNDVGNFREFKRGMWASRMQKVILGEKKRTTE